MQRWMLFVAILAFWLGAAGMASAGENAVVYTGVPGKFKRADDAHKEGAVA